MKLAKLRNIYFQQNSKRIVNTIHIFHLENYLKVKEVQYQNLRGEGKYLVRCVIEI